MEELVSIITPLYNSKDFLEDTINSVLRQSYRNFEMIIVDDSSNDGSCAIAETYTKKDKRIILIRLKQNCGVARARNVAIEASNGRYIAFLDSDDLWLPEKLEKQIAFMREKKAVFTYTAYRIIDEKNNMGGIVSVPARIDYKGLLNSCVIGCLTAMYDIESIGKQFMPEVDKEEYILWLRILKAGNVAHGLNEPLALYRVRSNSISHDKLNAARCQWNIYRKVENLSLLRSVYHFTSYAYYGYKKYKMKPGLYKDKR
jgi:glycosyltransferase involved in cell wall biosynthesis